MAYKNKEDQAAAAARHYEKNKEEMKARARAFNKKVRTEVTEFLRNLKGNTPCTDCEIQYPYYVMQFDHVRGTKLFDLGKNSAWRNLKRVQEEVAKCEIVCANCHAERTYQRLMVMRDGVMETHEPHKL